MPEGGTEESDKSPLLPKNNKKLRDRSLGRVNGKAATMRATITIGKFGTETDDARLIRVSESQGAIDLLGSADGSNTNGLKLSQFSLHFQMGSAKNNSQATSSTVYLASHPDHNEKLFAIKSINKSVIV